MTKQQLIQTDAASAVILQIPLEMLYISDLNPRKTVSEAHIESLADSIERFGLIHNLAGLMDEEGQHDEARMLVFIRDMVTRQFTIFEREIVKYPVNNFDWIVNNHGNFEAYESDRHAFTWQSHGSQFTIIEPVPEGATKFRITRNVPVLSMSQIIRLTRFKPDWVEILD